ncbi:MAG: hypothetical protein ABI175_08060, partial [Polyangiales bacterium]
ESITSLCFLVGLYAAGTFALVVVHRGFDLSAITGTTAAFVQTTLVTSLAVAIAGVGAYHLVRRDAVSLSLDLARVTAFGLVLTVAEPFVFGFRMGFPLPSAHLLFFPIVQAMMLLVHALLGVGVAIYVMVRARSSRLRRAAPAGPAPSS